MNGGPSDNAPVTRSFVIACGLFTLFFGIQGGSNKLGFSYQDIFRKLRLWKIVASVFAFSSTPELMFGLYLLYYFRVFERQIGSNKYSVFMLFSVIVSLLFEVSALALLRGDLPQGDDDMMVAMCEEDKLSNLMVDIFGGFSVIEIISGAEDPTANLLTSGPYGVIFASFVPFFFDIPVSTWFRLFGVSFSDKTFIYLAGLQFPEFIVSFLSRLSWPSSGSPRGATTRNAAASAPPFAGRHVERAYPAATAPMEPPEDSIATLVSMGFDRNSARQALMRARNDVNAATNILLEAQSQ
ncbi:hypothetical protein Tsubulata_021813 [Turnera subulata]|uniref:UBA domain-containing protein n=1 Tax=Turnera subulata TaxID=218843 RepID=A0A9Q0F6G8_9ROSI|nr:hypothetical protein Tsubulata_021813 [Turnera subulata]